VDLRRDVLARAEFPLRVSDELKVMDAELFHPHLMGLTLPPAPPHHRIAALG
jgi:acyl CoA:acetate/3-ketoacid CoA transferase